ncbi:MAG: ATP-dependent helicase HrpB [Candidatus Thiodiazotropha sp. (ex Monitilora ramsayi)]|nr:ATP-dependent helicase HrpB [Candidatus Thiodiazotropha sp. (ex Monitilora ramsayi)]
MGTDKLPVKAAIPSLSTALVANSSAVLCAPPGSGKTTLVPLELLQSSWLTGRILMLEPRRLAARAAAGRMAFLLGEAVGETVGYAIRLERRVSAKTRIEVVTEGILTQRLQKDPSLEGVSLVIFDEFHERNLQSDLALALSLDAQQGLREDLRLLVMSATLDSEWVSALLGGAPVVKAEGRSYPVTLHYSSEHPDKRRIVEQTVNVTLQAFHRESGDLLVFLPGVGEIKRTLDRLRNALSNDAAAPIFSPLYGDLPKAEQDRALLPDPGGRRRIVLTTSIAETSLTIEGVTTVVDSGWSRLPAFLPGIGLTRLETVPISRAAADQRAGRAGRVGPGVCYRLWSASYHDRLPAFHPAEILQADLAPLVLDLARWGVSDPDQLHWPEPPPVAAYSQACDLLVRLGALDQRRRITTQGRSISRLPLHPRLAHMLLHAAPDERQAVCDLAALLSERDILPYSSDSGRSVDMTLRLRLLERWRTGDFGSSGRGSGDIAAMRQVDRLSHDWKKRLPKREPLSAETRLSVAQYLALAYPDRIAQRTGHARFRLVSGRAVRLPAEDPLAGEEYLVAAQLDAGRTEGWVRLAAAIDEAEIRQLPDLQLTSTESVAWDSSAERVVMLSRECLGTLTLKESPISHAAPAMVLEAMLAGVRSMGLSVLPWSRPLRQWQDRVCWLREVLEGGGLPDLSDEWLATHLEDWLSAWLDGVTRKVQLQRLDLPTILKAMLSWDQQQQIEREAPSHIYVPSGSRIPLKYSPGESPILAVRLQELFGLSETPRIGEGRVPIMLHLLSPAQRPMQITDDLGGFWQRTYPEVKKELMGRYPKHYWPDDPMQAKPTARTKPSLRRS